MKIENSSLIVHHFIPGDGPNALIESISMTEEVKVKILTLYKLDQKVPKFCLENGIEISSLGFENPSLFRQVFKFLRYIRSEKPKVVFAHSYYPSLICAVVSLLYRKTIFVPVRHHNQVHILSGNTKAIFLDKIITWFTQHTVAVSDSVKETLIAQGSDKRKVTVIYNGLSKPGSCYMGHNSSELKSVYKLVALGRIDWQKNYETMLRVIWRLRKDGYDVNLQILGGGNLQYLESLKVLQKDLGLLDCVSWLGRQSNIYSFLDDSDLFIHTAIDEACPLVLIETLMYGIPIASSNLGGSRDVLSGFYKGCDPNDIEGFSQMVTNMLANLNSSREYALSISNAAVEKFDSNQMQQKYTELSLQLLSQFKV
jgi:glycosyltransferase involved in cell wall biosynthesis